MHLASFDYYRLFPSALPSSFPYQANCLQYYSTILAMALRIDQARDPWVVLRLRRLRHPDPINQPTATSPSFRSSLVFSCLQFWLVDHHPHRYRHPISSVSSRFLKTTSAFAPVLASHLSLFLGRRRRPTGGCTSSFELCLRFRRHLWEAYCYSIS